MRRNKIPENDSQLDFGTGNSVSFDFNAFDDFILTHGVQLQHFRSLRCPIGLSDKYDTRKTQDCHLDCSNGFLFTKGGLISVVFSGNSRRESDQDIGFLQDSSAQVSVPIHYDGTNEKIHLTRYDRFYLCDADITVQNWELIEAHASGVDRLSFKAVCVVDLVDSRGIVYKQDEDFSIDNGKVRWTGQNRPGQDIDTGKGRVYTVRYSYRPFWYLKTMMHEIRVSQSNFPIDSSIADTKREVRQLPYHVSLQREYMFQNESKDPDTVDSNNARAMPVPSSGGFGVR